MDAWLEASENKRTRGKYAGELICRKACGGEGKRVHGLFGTWDSKAERQMPVHGHNLNAGKRFKGSRNYLRCVL
jgi:hypothetical protein